MWAELEVTGVWLSRPTHRCALCCGLQVGVYVLPKKTHKKESQADISNTHAKVFSNERYNMI